LDNEKSLKLHKFLAANSLFCLQFSTSGWHFAQISYTSTQKPSLSATNPEINIVTPHPTLNKLTVTEGDLTGYTQYADSDCLNGAVLQVPDGRHLVNTLSSHHYLLMAGQHLADIEMMGQLFDIEIEKL
jgi:hypothetical protein